MRYARYVIFDWFFPIFGKKHNTVEIADIKGKSWTIICKHFSGNFGICLKTNDGTGN